jgi:hypothetical protein
MDIDEFLEQDIATFLDEAQRGVAATSQGNVPLGAESAPSVFMTRDYEREFLAALDEQSMTQAKRVLHALKEKFDEYPSGTPEKHQLKLLLMDLYGKFKEFLETQDAFERMDVALSHPDSGLGILEPQREAQSPARAPPAPSLSAAAQPRAAMQEPPTVAPDSKRLEREEQARAAARPLPQAPIQTSAVPAAPASFALPAQEAVFAVPARAAPPAAQAAAQDTAAQAKVSSLLDDVERAIASGSVPEAIEQYRAARHTALNLRAVPPELALRIVQTFAQIRDCAKRQRATLVGERAKRERETQLREMDRELLVQLERKKRELDTYVHRGDLAVAMRCYRQMRTLAQQITQERVAEEAARKLVRIYQIINTLRRHGGSDERSLLRKVP